jgi:hypothetical protein
MSTASNSTLKHTQVPILPLDESAEHAMRLAEMAKVWPDREHAEAAVTAMTITERLHELNEVLAAIAGVQEVRAA